RQPLRVRGAARPVRRPLAPDRPDLAEPADPGRLRATGRRAEAGAARVAAARSRSRAGPAGRPARWARRAPPARAARPGAGRPPDLALPPAVGPARRPGLLRDAALHNDAPAGRGWLPLGPR